MPDGVKELIAWRLARLRPGTEDVLALAATVGSDFELTLLEGLAGGREPVVRALEDAVGGGFIDEREDPGHYSFAHALVRETMYQGLTGTRRALTHLHIGELLERRYGSEPGAAAADGAHHFAEARPFAPPTKIRDYLMRAARDAAEALAFETAAGYLRRALEVAAPLDARHEFELLGPA